MTELNKYYETAEQRFQLMQQFANSYGDFKIMKSWFENGTPCFATWRTVIETTQRDDSYKDEFSHRQIFPFELVLDMDEVELIPRAKDLFNRLYDDAVIKELYLFETGSKGIHIHIFLLEEYKKYAAYNPRKWRELRKKAYDLISFWGFDVLKASQNVPIALEFAPHWKSGKQKRLIKGRGKFYERD